jgi:hypothetical protein
MAALSEIQVNVLSAGVVFALWQSSVLRGIDTCVNVL